MPFPPVFFTPFSVSKFDQTVVLCKSGRITISLAVEFEIQQHFFFYEVELTETFVAKEGVYESFPKEGKLDLIYERKQEEVEFAQAADEAIAEATRKML